MDRYELIEGTASKFWEADVEGATLTVRFGRVGTQGQSKDKTFPDAAAALKEKGKLVREKTGKGYRPAGAAPAAEAEGAPAGSPAAEPAEAAPAPADPPETVSHVAEPSRALFDGTPLPTRLRPGPPVDATRAWPELRERLVALRGTADDLPSADQAPADRGPWVALLVDAFVQANNSRSSLRTLRGSGAREGLETAMHWLVQSEGAVAAVKLADRADGARPAPHPTSSYAGLSWADPMHLALRAALVHAPERDYDAAVAFLSDRIAAAPDWPSAATFAFVLADDRPARHALQPLAVLEAAAAAGVDVGAELRFLPLVADCDPAAVAPWRTRRSYFLYLCYGLVDAAEAAATLIAVARAAGRSALPSLDWLMHSMIKEERTTVAKAVLATGAPGALAVLLPILHEKPVAAALDAATAADPAAFFAQCVTVLAGGRAEPALRARVAEAVDRHGAAVARDWLRDGEPRTGRYLDQLVAARDVPPAARPDWPRVLRDPPWRQRTRVKDDIVLDLAPLATPYGFAPPDTKPQRYTWRDRGARVLASMEDLIAVIREAESTPRPHWTKVLPATGVPSDRTPWSEALPWLVARLADHARTRFGLYGSGYETLYRGLERQPEPLALALWEETGALIGSSSAMHFPDALPAMMERFGARALPGLVKLVESDPVAILPLVGPVDAADLAPLAARAFLKLKKARPPALAWLRGHRETAAVRLVPDAVGPSGAARDAAEHALRWFAADRDDGRTAVEAAAARYAAREPRAAEALAQVLDRDPLARVPAKVGRPPAWVVPSALGRPRLRGGGALPDEAVLALCEMLSFTNPDAVYAGIGLVREACTPDSLAGFASDLFSAWVAAGTPSKDGWALRALGWFGDDACARDLARLIRRWPGEAAHGRAVTGLDVLVDIGSDVALMHLNGIAEKLKFKGLQEKAREKIAVLAEARGLSPDELSDRLAPDLDLDARGGLDLDFGPRVFRAGFDETLKPWVRDAAGGRLKDLPKPLRSDDADKAAAALARWGALKKDARATASLQVARLEAMLATSRRVRPEVFHLFFAAHPLLRHLTQRLVWASFADADPRTLPSTTFRVAEDLGFTDAADEPVTLDTSADAPGLVGLLHPLHLPDGGLAPWGALFGDYEIAQPFPQLGRETYALTEAEKAAAVTKRFDGIAVESKRLRGMGARGWRLGSPQDGGGIWWIERDYAFPDGTDGTASLSFADGLVTGAPDFGNAEQVLGELVLESRWGARQQAATRTFGTLDPVTASELLRGPSLLAEARLR